MDRETLCRLCATQLMLENACNVFKDENFQYPQSLKYLINLYLRIDINIEDNMPSVVCNSCSGKMLDFHMFAIECNKVQEYFKNFPLPYMCDPLKMENLPDQSQAYDDDFSNIEDTKSIWEEMHKKLQANFDDSEKYNNKSLSKGTFHSSEIHANLEVQLNEGGRDDCYSSKKSANIKTKNQSIEKKIKKRSNVKQNDDDEDYCDSSMKSANRKFNCQSSEKMEKGQPNVQNECETKIVQIREKRDPKVITFTCDVCNKSFKLRDSLTRHKKTHIPKEEYTFTCSQCPKKFLTAKSMRAHEATHLPKETRSFFSCSQCESKFTTKGILQSHIRAIHENAQPFVCNVCEFACTSKAILQEHLLVHTEERPFPCPKCSQKFKSKFHVQRHIKNHHNEIKIQCPHCPMMLKNRRTFLKHLSVHKGICEFTCSTCDKVFRKKINLMVHMNSHLDLQPFSCMWCTETFTGLGILQIHLNKMHSVEYDEYGRTGENKSAPQLSSSTCTDPANIDIKKSE